MRIVMLGDIALFGMMSKKNNPQVESYFSEIADYLGEFDYVVGNLETPFSIEKKTRGAKSAHICSDVDNIKTLKQLHINAVCLANNHMFDFGYEGYETTKSILRDNGIEFFGTEGMDLKIDMDSCRIVFSGYCCYSSNPLNCVPKGEYGVNAYNIGQVSQSIKDNDSQGYLNIVAVHAGLEHVNYPSIDHVRAARKLADVAPYVYYGHHPHVIQGIEKYKNSLIAYSLGNFCFDDVYTAASTTTPLITLTENNRLGLMLELRIENNKIVSWHEHVIRINKDERLSLIEKNELLDSYNEALVHCEEKVDEYERKRLEILNKRISERKAMRNVQWYLKRLRPKYVKLILDGRKNAKLYNENVKKYI